MCPSSRIVKYIGHGQFGTVNLAVWTQEYVEPMEVAVKVCRAGAVEAVKTKFLKEAAIMGQFRHPNVVKLYGVVTMSEQVCCMLCNCVTIQPNMNAWLSLTAQDCVRATEEWRFVVIHGDKPRVSTFHHVNNITKL